MACLFEDVLIHFLHSMENIDFIKIIVFLQENNGFCIMSVLINSFENHVFFHDLFMINR